MAEHSGLATLCFTGQRLAAGQAGGQEDLRREAVHRDLGGCPQQILRSDVWDSAWQTSSSARKLLYSPPP